MGPSPVPHIAAPVKIAMGVFLSLVVYMSLKTPPTTVEKTEHETPAKARVTSNPAKLVVNPEPICITTKMMPEITKTGLRP